MIIYLQGDPEDTGTTWCTDRINESDVEYIRADELRGLIKQWKDKQGATYQAHIEEVPVGVVFRECADDLEKLLSPTGDNQGPRNEP